MTFSIFLQSINIIKMINIDIGIEIIILIIFFSLFFYKYFKNANEGFQSINNIQYHKMNDYWDLNWKGKHHPDCYSLNLRGCNKYSNCGVCIKDDGTQQCVPGDEFGALFKEGCKWWQYTDYYDSHPYRVNSFHKENKRNYYDNEKYYRIVHGWDKIYPDYEAWYPSPVSRSALR